MIAWAALALLLLWLLVAFGLRSSLQRRRTGDTGWRSPGGQRGTLQWWSRTIIGFGVPDLIALAGLAAAVFGVQAQVRRIEEPYLLRTHGDAYRRSPPGSAGSSRVGPPAALPLIVTTQQAHEAAESTEGGPGGTALLSCRQRLFAMDAGLVAQALVQVELERAVQGDVGSEQLGQAAQIVPVSCCCQRGTL